ncbi:MAG: hypothetical protein Q9160_008337 [Pyrenula sp. 1 TL-2023]
MATTFPQTHPPPTTSRNAPFNAPIAASVSHAPAGTFIPGTKVQCGGHRVIIEKYLSEGGFAHVYVVRLPKPVDGNDVAVLKRVAVPDKDHLANMRTEVETMKKLKGHRHIVRYIDSHASQLKGGGYEVFLLMEFCSGGGLIDFMNTRLQNRLTEPEILHIFSDVAEGVACMHYLKPPLLHRDLKVENVLISTSRSGKTYKLCDFGSTAPPRPAATTAAEGRLIEDDIQQHTTLQYRSPEMIDVYRKQPIDEKSDIWALGVLLYKLCYYTTPFEEVGQMAILNASFKYPSYPIYTGRTDSEARRNQQLPPSPKDAAPSAGAAVWSPPKQEKQTLPDITPMRRGRPTKPISHTNSARPSPSPLRFVNSNDPFSTLDGGKSDRDELSSRFPTLDQFSILHEGGQGFEFDASNTNAKDPSDAKLSKRVTNALADEAFVKSPPPGKEQLMPPDTKPISKAPRPLPQRRESLESRTLPKKPPQAESVSRKPMMVSVGTMTSPPSPPPDKATNHPIHRFPPFEPRSSRNPWEAEKDRSRIDTEVPAIQRTNIFVPDLKSKSTTEVGAKSPASSRPSLEGPRPSTLDIDVAGDSFLTRSRSANNRQRPLSVNSGQKKDLARPSFGDSVRQHSFTRGDDSSPPLLGDTETNISSDMDFLRAKEEEESERKRDKRLSGGSINLKRSSLPSISLSGTKNLLAGRFGDAFRKFESNTNEKGQRSRSPSPMRHPLTLAPIAGSEATETSNEDYAIDETEDVSPEMRRELERRRLSQEEKRVADAAAEYKQRLAQKGAGGMGGGQVNRAVTIQNKVHSLLKENDKPATKTATGYGRFTNTENSPQIRPFDATTNKPLPGPPAPSAPPQSERFPANTIGSGLRKVASDGQGLPNNVQTTSQSSGLSKPQPQVSTQNAGVPSSIPARNTGQARPTAPPKPKTLRTGQQESPTKRNDAVVNDDWEAQFTKKYPSLNKLEMVETEIGGQGSKNAPSRVREV